MKIFFDNTGPLIRYDTGRSTLEIEDLNPERQIRWRISRLELLCIGLRCLLAAVKP